jgi:YlmC/YmxH family sporulation protein
MIEREENMMREYMTQLTEKQVINICDGRILGYVSDFKIDPCDGRLTAIILPGECGLFSFKKSYDIIIPWEKICKIGADTIIVDIGLRDCNCDTKKDIKKR